MTNWATSDLPRVEANGVTEQDGEWRWVVSGGGIEVGGWRDTQQEAEQAMAAEIAEWWEPDPPCLCHGEGPDRFGNYDQIVNPDCPRCANG